MIINMYNIVMCTTVHVWALPEIDSIDLYYYKESSPKERKHNHRESISYVHLCTKHLLKVTDALT